MAEEIKRIFGVPFPTCATKEFVDILDAYSVKDLDTAALYPGSEQGIGDEGLPKRFTIHTKAEHKPGGGNYEAVLKSAAASLEKLRVESVETYFLHAPDPETPFPQTLDAIQKLYKEGKFKRFGISNFLPAQVQEVYDYCSLKGYVLPTVFQGSYNPVARHAEEELFPLLRKLKISFYAYGALAGGFLTKSAEYFSEAGSETRAGSRWDRSTDYGELFNSLYNKPSFIAALKDWDTISKESGISKADLSYRWVAYNSYLSKDFGDGIILGALKSEQLGRTLEGLKNGPLEESIVEKINAVWENVKHEAPFHNFRPQKP